MPWLSKDHKDRKDQIASCFLNFGIPATAKAFSCMLQHQQHLRVVRKMRFGEAGVDESPAAAARSDPWCLGRLGDTGGLPVLMAGAHGTLPAWCCLWME